MTLAGNPGLADEMVSKVKKLLGIRDEFGIPSSGDKIKTRASTDHPDVYPKVDPKGVGDKMPVDLTKQFTRFTRLPLAIEITLILAIKIAILTLLWKAFFSEPQTKKMRMPTALVEKHFLTPQAVTIPSYSSTQRPPNDPNR